MVRPSLVENIEIMAILMNIVLLIVKIVVVYQNDGNVVKQIHTRFIKLILIIIIFKIVLVYLFLIKMDIFLMDGTLIHKYHYLSMG